MCVDGAPLQRISAQSFSIQFERNEPQVSDHDKHIRGRDRTNSGC